MPLFEFDVSLSGKLVSDYQLNNNIERQNTCDIIYYYSIFFYVGVMTIIVSRQVCISDTLQVLLTECTLYGRLSEFFHRIVIHFLMD